MEVVKRHTDGVQGKRGCDSIAVLFAQVVAAMEATRNEVRDVLGDLYAGAITYGEAGQYYTPIAITDLMAELATQGVENEDELARKKSVLDPCCGSGRMLMSVARHHPHWEFVGQDVDLRCVRLCAINMGLRNMYGYAIWGNSLKLEQKIVYRTGFNLKGGVIREVSIEDCPEPVQEVAQSEASQDATESDAAAEPGKQLRLF